MMTRLFSKGQRMDFKFVEGVQSFSAHKFVLAARSKFLRELILSGYKDISYLWFLIIFFMVSFTPFIQSLNIFDTKKLFLTIVSFTCMLLFFFSSIYFILFHFIVIYLFHFILFYFHTMVYFIILSTPHGFTF